MDKHYPPVFRQKQFHCPICNVYASQEFGSLVYSFNTTASSPIWYSHCQHCQRKCYWQRLESGGRLLIPDSTGTPLAHEDMPPDVRADYDEAASIFSRSPRGAAALLRLAVQKLMINLGQAGKNINQDIAALVAAGLPSGVQKALDFCRVVGNNAVHPGEIDLSDTPEVASAMFGLLNFIVQDRIARPKELEALYAELPEEARNAIAKRDEKLQS